MAQNKRRQARSGAGPGRSNRSRPVSRSSAKTPTREAQPSSSKSRGVSSRPKMKGVRVTRRAVICIALLFVILLSWIKSITTYFSLQNELHAKEASVAAKQADIASLEDQIQRWKDPNYVKAQARDRLGWVVPGETGYVVLDSSGRPVTGSSTVADTTVAAPAPLQWWEKVGDSIAAADAPATDQPVPVPAPTAKKS